MPKYHIPARFVTLIPREFPASQGNPAAAANKTNKRKGTPLQAAPQAKRQQTVDDIFGMDFGDNLDALDLDFDKPLGADEVEDDFPPIF